MVITKLVEDKKKNYYILTVDSKEYTFHEEVVLKFRLVPGVNITEEQLNECINKNDYESAYSKALSYIIKFPQSVKSLERYLSNKEYNDDIIRYVISKLKENKLIDDYKYGLSLMNSYILQGYGYNMLKSKLGMKLISADNISLILEKINYDDYYIALAKLIDKAKKKYDKKPNTRLFIIKYLYGRGYLMEEINQELNKIENI